LIFYNYNKTNRVIADIYFVIERAFIVINVNRASVSTK
jgi:hypothetical protein